SSSGGVTSKRSLQWSHSSIKKKQSSYHSPVSLKCSIHPRPNPGLLPVSRQSVIQAIHSSVCSSTGTMPQSAGVRSGHSGQSHTPVCWYFWQQVKSAYGLSQPYFKSPPRIIADCWSNASEAAV